MDKEEVRAHLTGPVSAIRTPFKRDGSVDENGFRNYIEASLVGGSKSIILTAGDSHYYCLTDDEIAHLTKVAVEQTAGRAMVVAADYFYSTDRAVEFARFVKETGADIYMLLPPTWGGCTAADLAQHYVAVGEVMPVMMVTAVFAGKSDEYALETIRIALDESDQVMAIKDDRGGPFVHQMCMETHERCALFAGGQKRLHLSMVPFGCDGYMSVYVTLKPELSSKYWNAVTAADFATARAIDRDFDVPLFDYAMAYPGGWNCVFHALLEVYGVAERWKRAPYTSLSDKEVDQLRSFLTEKGLL